MVGIAPFFRRYFSELKAHVSEHAVNKQLADKERVRAALENEHLLGVVDRCISGGMQMQ